MLACINQPNHTTIIFLFLLLNRFWGNRFETPASYPPWNFPLDSVPHEKNISSPPTTQQSAVVDYPSPEVSTKIMKKMMSPVGILACVVVGVVLVSFAALFFAIHINRAHEKRLGSLDSSNSTMHSLPVSTLTVGESSTYSLIFSRVCVDTRCT